MQLQPRTHLLAAARPRPRLQFHGAPCLQGSDCASHTFAPGSQHSYSSPRPRVRPYRSAVCECASSVDAWWHSDVAHYARARPFAGETMAFTQARIWVYARWRYNSRRIRKTNVEIKRHRRAKFLFLWNNIVNFNLKKSLISPLLSHEWRSKYFKHCSRFVKSKNFHGENIIIFAMWNIY